MITKGVVFNETGLSKPTVLKWWDKAAEDLAAERAAHAALTVEAGSADQEQAEE